MKKKLPWPTKLLDGDHEILVRLLRIHWFIVLSHVHLSVLEIRLAPEAQFFSSILPESVHWPLEYQGAFFKAHAASQACLLHFSLFIRGGGGGKWVVCLPSHMSRDYTMKQEPSALPRGLVSQWYMQRGWDRCPGVSVSPRFLHSSVLMEAQMVSSDHGGSVGA